MATDDIAAAMQRTERVLRRRPSAGLHDDAPGVARWDGGVRVVASHPAGHQVSTDMPTELGGTGDQVSPGWLMRAGLASCAATCIAMTAAAEGIALDALEVEALSRSDTRGLLGMAETDGALVYPGPQDLRMRVRIEARGVAPERLRAVTEAGLRVAPIRAAIQDATPLTLLIETNES